MLLGKKSGMLIDCLSSINQGILAHSPRCNNGDIAQEEEEKTSQILTVCSDLPIDMLIMTSGLLLADRIRVTAVCKSWLVPSQEIRSMRARIATAQDQLPWIMTSQFTRRKKIVTSSSESSSSESELTCRRREFVRSRHSNHVTCKLYDPCYKKQVPYVINHIHKTTEGVDNRNRTGIDLDARACTSKQGWVMFYHTREVQYWSFFLFNPITGEIITQLPDLYSTDCCFDVATFSTSPTSPDCVFFILKQDKILTCCRGDKAWNLHNMFDDDHHHLGPRPRPHPLPIYKDAIYVDGSFYCVSSCGTLAAFSVAGQEWTMLTTYFEPLVANRVRFGERLHLVEYNGELLLVTINHDDDEWCKLFRFDKSGSVWVSKEGGLEDRALFVGECSSFSVSTIGKNAALLNNNIANKVYYHHFSSVVDRSASTSQTKFCSFEEGSKSQCCEGSFEDIYGWVRDTRQQRFWIQPPS